MKILFYTTFLTSGGGLEVAAIDYINKFIEKGYEIDLLVDYNFGKENIREKQISKKINITYLKSEKLSKLIYKLRTLGKKNKIYNIFLYTLIILSDFIIWNKLLKEIEKKKYDVTITFFQYLPSYITKIKGVKHLIFLHGSVEHYFVGIRKYFKENYGNKLNKFDYICTVSQGLKNQVEELFPFIKSKKLKVIYNPINFQKILKLSTDYSEIKENEKELLKSKYICTVCRIDESQKDLKTLIGAYSKLNNDVKLIIIGEGPDKENLEKYIKKLDLNNIYFLGNKKNPYVWINNCELFILSSKFEGFGLVLVEALLLNKKVISSNCKVGPEEILENGKYGELFEVVNSKELLEKIEKSLRENKGLDSKKYVMNKFGNGFEKLEKIISGENRYVTKN